MKKNKKTEDELVIGSIPNIKGVVSRNISWGVVSFLVIIGLLIALLAIIYVPKYQHRQDVDNYSPSVLNTDPSNNIPGVVKKYYPYRPHVTAQQRVAYDQSPPFGGPNDRVWATCMGNIYKIPIRNENAVRSLSNGAIWITYNPAKITDAELAVLESKVKNQTYIFMSPYPNLDTPISVQSWGHQLKLSDPNDKRIDHFITALKQNKLINIYPGHDKDSAYPSVGSSCGVTPGFDPHNPNPWNNSPLPRNAINMNGEVGK